MIFSHNVTFNVINLLFPGVVSCTNDYINKPISPSSSLKCIFRFVTIYLFILVLVSSVVEFVGSVSGFLFLNEYFCKLVTSQHNFIPSRTKEGFCCCCRVSFFVCIKKKTKRKAGRIKRNVRGKFSCPIRWNMFTEGILIWVLEREGTM